MPSGIIVKGIGGFYYVKTEEGLYECKARGIFRKDDTSPLPGDKVKISITDGLSKKGSIDEIFERHSQLIRPAVANVDQVAVVIAVKSPVPDFTLLDKLLITAEMKGLSAILCVNKIDLDDGEVYNNIATGYSKASYKTIAVSSKLDIGYHELKEALKGKITVFAGQSGVGKSTILNRIMNSSIMETGSVSEKIERGKHTTRHAELIELDTGGFVADTPGFSSYELSDLGYGELEIFYPEFSECLNKCKFSGCSHISEPGCCIKEALEAGKIDSGRYERYIGLYTHLKSIKGYDNKGNTRKSTIKKSLYNRSSIDN